MRHLSSEDLQSMAADEWPALLKAPPVKIVLSPEVAFLLIAQLQLALRHPGNTGRSADLARGFIKALVVEMRLPPALAESVERGWDPAFDEPRGERGEP